MRTVRGKMFLTSTARIRSVHPQISNRERWLRRASRASYSSIAVRKSRAALYITLQQPVLEVGNPAYLSMFVAYGFLCLLHIFSSRFGMFI